MLVLVKATPACGVVVQAWLGLESSQNQDRQRPFLSNLAFSSQTLILCESWHSRFFRACSRYTSNC